MLTENRSDVPNAGFEPRSEGRKGFTSRNVDQEAAFKPPIAEDPEEESKSDRQLALNTNAEDLQQYATIADNLPASHTEIDPTPQIKGEADYATGVQPAADDEKAEHDSDDKEEEAADQDKIRDESKTQIQPAPQDGE